MLIRKQKRVQPFCGLRFPDRGLSRYEQSRRETERFFIFTVCAFILIALAGFIRIL